MEKLRLYNTLTKRVEPFEATNNTVNMYTCGPTVYYFAHIGNFRAYVFMDTLRRVLKHNGYKVNTVMNITDVGHLTDDADSGEDKMEVQAKKENKSPYEIAEHYTSVFFEDAKKLNIEFSDIQVKKATDHIDDMIEFVKGLIETGYAYEVEGDVYFDVAKYNSKYHYGELSGVNLDDQLAGARIEVNKKKRSPYDFALWIKAPKEHIMKWNSPWSIGYPGWHIECSAMGKKYLGNQFDIHTGGVDHIPIHHANEIAQSKGLTGENQARFWMHCEFLKVDNGKMSKSLGNAFTIADLEKKGYSALDYRYLLLNANFRKVQNFTWEALEGAKIAREKLVKLALKHYKGRFKRSDLILKKKIKEFYETINNDLNIPLAIGYLWKLMDKTVPSEQVFKLIIKADKILGLNLKEEVEKLEEANKEENNIPEDIKILAKKRFEAKQNKDWAKSDRLRDELKQMGYTINDSKDSYEIVKD